MNRLREILNDRAPQFAAALAQIVSNSYGLQDCTPESVIGAAIKASALDLSVDPNIGEAHLVPYGDKCQLQIGYKGFTQLAMRSGQFKTLGWKAVCDGEFVSYDELDGTLVLDAKSKKNDNPVGYAAKFTLVNGFTRASYWTVQEVKDHAQRFSQAYQKKRQGPWISDFDKMALKTVLKDLLNTWGPKSIQMQTALARDQRVFRGLDDEGDYGDNAPAIIPPKFDAIPENVQQAQPDPAKRGPGRPPKVVKPSEPTPTVPPPEEQPIVTVRRLCSDAVVPETLLVAYLRNTGQVDESLMTLDDVNTVSPDTLSVVVEAWPEIQQDEQWLALVRASEKTQEGGAK